MLRFSLQFLLFGLILLLSGNVFAQQDQTATDSPTVAELVEQLRSSEREVRESAEKQLIDRGPAILDELPEYDAFKSPSLRTILFRVRNELESQKIEASLFSTTLKFPVRDLTLAEAVDFIREETGNDLRLSDSLDLPTTPVPIIRAECTFWEAVLQIIKTYNLDLEVDPHNRGLVLVPAKTKRAYFTNDYTDSKHPVRPFAWRLNHVERKPIAARDAGDLLRFELQLLWEPRLTPMFLKFSGNQKAEGLVTTQKDDGRRDLDLFTLIPFSPEAMTEIPCHQLPISPAFRVDWKIPAHQKVQQVGFAPRAEVTLAVGRFDFEFQNWDQPRFSLRRGMGVVVRDELLVTDDEVSFRLILLFSERGAPFESHREWLSQNLIELKSGDQVMKPSAPPEKELEADGSVAFRYKFARPQGMPEDWTLHYRFPTSFRDIEIRSEELFDLAEWIKPKLIDIAP